MTAAAPNSAAALRMDVVAIPTSVHAGPGLMSQGRTALVATVSEADGSPVTTLPREAFTVSIITISAAPKGAACPIEVDALHELAPGVYALSLEANLRVRERAFACVVDVQAKSGSVVRRGRALTRVAV
jgi:hypothetical protein